MNWLLLVLTFVLLSPLPAASWESSALSDQWADTTLVVASDGFERDCADRDSDSDDALIAADLSRYTGYALRAASPIVACTHSQHAGQYAIRAPPYA
ncbi:hypothetical protein [Alteromonas halophila]|uniref:Uncharacterized protein n=1 Tax=Alteromonas halophila TaxID=516698 RepID=A0A918MWK1_9ALTE|nr:hypothetical protein [Alteromonas halophila]GGW78031.1 hypothetical protein GCM10007391_08230 [Alteromonas halophila]